MILAFSPADITLPPSFYFYKARLLQGRNYPEAWAAFEVSSPVSLSVLNSSSWTDGAQMDSKVGMSLKIHGTHHDQFKWREGVGIKH